MMTKESIHKLTLEDSGSVAKNLTKTFEENSGATETQIYILTQKVARLSSHLRLHKKDYSSQRGLRKMLGQRKRLLGYLYAEDLQRYENLLSHLGIRGLKKV